jgi:DNA-binding IclR family transcriptional regulator
MRGIVTDEQRSNRPGQPPIARLDAFADDVRVPSSPQSVTRVIRLLEALCESARPLSLAELSRTIDAPKSSIAALLRGLADEHFVIAADGAWRLGPGAYGLGSALVGARRRFPAAELIREGMRRLSDRAGETVLLAIRDGDLGTMTYIDVIECRNAVRFSVTIGDRRPLYATAGGRALLSAGDDEEVARYLHEARPQQLTRLTEIDKTALAAAVAAARRDGVAQTIDQAADGVTGTAALVWSANGAPLGALIVAAPSQRTGKRLAELASMVREEAAAISRSLGYR